MIQVPSVPGNYDKIKTGEMFKRPTKSRDMHFTKKDKIKS